MPPAPAMFQCALILCCVLLHVRLATAANCNCSSSNRDGIQGCHVDNGHAECESRDLAGSIMSLPACTTNITFSLLPDPNITTAYDHWIILKNVDFSHLKFLTELSIYSSRDSHTQVGLTVVKRPALEGLSKLKVLRLKVQQSRVYHLGDSNMGLYADLKSLQVLDLTRAQNLGLSAAKHVIGKHSSIETLILKNIQEIHRDLIYTPSIDLGYFICGGYVQYLDLSYNDITYVTVSSDKCNSKLQFLNLDHNIIATARAIPTDSVFRRAWYSLSMMASARKISINSTWQLETYQEGLWHDDSNYVIDWSPNVATGQSIYTPFLRQTPFGFLAEYGSWIDDIMKHCGDISYLDMLRCKAYVQGDSCAFFHCLFPQKFDNDCPKDDSVLQLEYFVRKMCGYYEHCEFSLPFPLPPQLNSVFMQSFGRYTKLVSDYSTNKSSTICIHPHNNLEMFDISHSTFAYLQSVPGARYVTGLEKLKYFNVQGCQLPLHRIKLVFSDRGSNVTELHIGGNIVSPNNMVPVDLLQAHKKLSILNLSNANLVGFEKDAFMNLPQLSVLDLSHNHLHSSALSSFDLSQTRIRSLNLSNNLLTTIPGSLRTQLTQKQDLEVVLSGNAFLCSCDNLGFLQWVQSSSFITFHSVGDYVCADSPGNTIFNIDVDALLCDWYWMQPVIAVGSSLALTSLALALFGAYKRRWTIRNLIFRLQERFFSPPDDTATTPYKYDAFVLYSSIPDDRLWVHFKLVQELENVFGFRLCIHHRDFLGGCDIVDNIEQAIHSSRKVLVIMSENFMRSEWCVEEVHMTSSVDRKKFIVVMYRDVMLSAAPMPAVVRRLLESRTYIEWDEAPQAQQLFWKKLRRALYSKRRGSTVCPGEVELGV